MLCHFSYAIERLFSTCLSQVVSRILVKVSLDAFLGGLLEFILLQLYF